MTLLELLNLMRQHIKLMIVLPVMCALAVGIYCFGFMADTFTASTSMYVLVKSDDVHTTNSDLSASQMLTNDVATLIKSDRVMKDSARDLKMDSLQGYNVTVDSQTTTRVIKLSVSGKDAQSCASIANGLAKNASKVAQEVMDVQSVNVIDQAITPDHPSGPNRTMYTLVAFMAGLFIALAVIVVMDIMNVKVRANELEELTGVPIIGRIPTLSKAGK